MPKQSRYTAGFKAEIVRSLLHDIAVPSEFTARFGVPPKEVREWLLEAIDHMDELFEKEDAAKKPLPHEPEDASVHLTPMELDILLHDDTLGDDR